LTAATGATVPEIMQRLGHSTPTMALRYMHVMSDRPAVIAELLSKIRREHGEQNGKSA